ncbi:MAG TPA: peptidoglycan-binding domain-containing protein, partial [Cyanophyceae cyanobacterium]
ETFAALGIGDIVTYAPPRSNRRRDITLRPGDRNIRVEELQRRLQAAGFYTGSIDGIYETGTTNSVKRLQRENNLPETGIANRDTQVALVSYRYVVVVPDPSGELLPQVRRRGFDAVSEESRRGAYVKAGVFNNRAKAESRAQLLRASKFDARVVFQ